MREDTGMDCGVAREALSARMDGEREPVPSARVDEHLAGCRLCTEWYRVARQQSLMLEAMAAPGLGAANDESEPPRRRPAGYAGLRYALGAIGVIQLGLALVQALGVDFGLVSSNHGIAGGAHLLNESTAWSAALGATLIAAAVRPVFAPGAVSAAGVYALVLAYYVAMDSMNGHVTAARVASHLPVLLGAALAFLLWRRTSPGRRRGDAPTASPPLPASPHSDPLS
ncbi:zf-HC2 domain-containing protein [Mycobacterium sp. WMMD1722]|uniref:zf-HC2 domain-containing protein n=1 Tax=Mycobacterium sp. WMMD1722 TaxID=3404117 RepID=UPI003BF4657A